jgi:hypothetical protein
MRRLLIVSLLMIGACATAMPPPRSALGQALALTPRNTRLIGSSTVDQRGDSFTVTGLSGITHVGGGTFWAVMDNSNKLVQLNVSFDADGDTTAATIAGGVSLGDTLDFEGIAFTTAARNSVFLADEGTPGVREYDLSSATRLQTLTTPAVFGNRRSNFGFESLARRAGGSDLWTANEEALTVDGALSTPTDGSPVRLLHYSLAGDSATPGAEYVYITDPLHGQTTSGSRSGLSDLVVLPDGTLLALERALANPGLIPTFESRIYEIDFAGATDVATLPGLIGQSYTPVTKHLLWKGQAGGLLGQNLEGLALGPKLADGNWSLLGIVDDADPVSNNNLIAFELTGASIPEPSAIGLTIPLGAWWFLKAWRR